MPGPGVENYLNSTENVKDFTKDDLKEAIQTSKSHNMLSKDDANNLGKRWIGWNEKKLENSLIAINATVEKKFDNFVAEIAEKNVNEKNIEDYIANYYKVGFKKFLNDQFSDIDEKKRESIAKFVGATTFQLNHLKEDIKKINELKHENNNQTQQTPSKTPSEGDESLNISAAPDLEIKDIKKAIFDKVIEEPKKVAKNEGRNTDAYTNSVEAAKKTERVLSVVVNNAVQPLAVNTLPFNEVSYDDIAKKDNTETVENITKNLNKVVQQKAKEQYLKTEQVLKKHKIPVDRANLKRDIGNQMNDQVMGAMKQIQYEDVINPEDGAVKLNATKIKKIEETTKTNIATIPDRLYYEYTGGILSSQVDDYFNTSYEVRGNIDDNPELINVSPIKRGELKNMMNLLHSIDNANNKIRYGEKRSVVRLWRVTSLMEAKDKTQATQSPEFAILNYAKNNPSEAMGLSDNQWKEKVEELGFTMKGRHRDDIQRLVQLFIQAHTPGTKSYQESPVFRRMTDLILQYGSVSKAHSSLKDDLEQTKKMLGMTREQRYGTLMSVGGKYEAAKNLDAKPEEKIDAQINLLVDYNLDGNIFYGDVGNTTGLQVKNMFGTTPEQKQHALDNLLAFMNRINKGNETGIKNNELYTLDNVTKIQALLKNPPMELNYIFKYGEEALNKYTEDHTSLAESLKQKEEMNKKVAEEVENVKKQAEETKEKLDSMPESAEKEQAKKNLETLSKLPDEKLRTGIAEVLYSQIAKIQQQGQGAGVSIPLSQILKGLSFNIGVTNADGKPNIGLNLAWNRSMQVSENGSVYAGASGGTDVLAVIPIFSANAGYAYTVKNGNRDESLSTKTDKILSAGGHAVYMPGILGRGLNVGIDADRVSAVEERYNTISQDIQQFGYGILDALTNNAGALKYDENNIRNYLEEKFGEKTDKNDIDNAVKNIANLLQYHDGVDMNPVNRQLLADYITKAYATAWKNEKLKGFEKDGIGGWYVSGGGLSVTFYGGVIPVVGILKFKNNSVNGSTDTRESLRKVKKAEKLGQGNRTLEGNLLREGNLAELANILQVDKKLLTEENGLVKLSKDLYEKNNVILRINQNMAGLLKKNGEGDILIHPDTPVRAFKAQYGDSYRTVLNIGGEKNQDGDVIIGENTKLNDIEGAFTENDIDTTKLPKLKQELTAKRFNDLVVDVLNNTISDSKIQKIVSNLDLSGDDIKNGNITYQELNQSKTFELKPGNDLVISIKNRVATLEQKQTPENRNFGIEVVNQDTISELVPEIMNTMDKNIEEAITDTYAEAKKISSNALRNIGHLQAEGTLNTNYMDWRDALKAASAEKNPDNQDKIREKAKEAFKILLLNMIKYINKYQDADNQVNFAKLQTQLKGAKGVDLQQLLIAIDGLFSRTASVKGGGENYTLKKYVNDGTKLEDATISDIAHGNKTEILNKIQRELIQDGYTQKEKDAFEKLFNKIQKEVDNVKEQHTYKTETLTGIAYNYGNPQDMERPIINPEVVKDISVGVNDAVLKEHFLKQLYEKDTALVQGLINRLQNQGLSETDVEKLFIGKSVDNGGKKYTIEGEFTMRFFAQCVNHMLVAENLKVKVESNTPGGDGPNSNQEKQSRRAEIASNNVVENIDETSSTLNANTRNFAVAATVGEIKKSRDNSSSVPGEEEEKISNKKDGTKTNPQEKEEKIPEINRESNTEPDIAKKNDTPKGETGEQGRGE